MTEKEVVKEVLSDMYNAFRYEDANQNKFRRIVIKSSRFPVYMSYVYTSKNKNKWIIQLEARNKKEYGEFSRIRFIVLHNTPHGIYAIMVSFVDGMPELIFYPPHFFSRFKERTRQSLSGVELIARFFKYNSSYVYETKGVQLPGNMWRTEIYGSTEEGVAMGVKSVEGNILFKTFVTYDMLKGEQIGKFSENERIRQEIHK